MAGPWFTPNHPSEGKRGSAGAVPARGNARVRLKVAVNEVERLALRAVAPRRAALPTGQVARPPSARWTRAECSQREHSHLQSCPPLPNTPATPSTIEPELQLDLKLQFLVVKAVALVCLQAAFLVPQLRSAELPPNIILIFCDDLAYADVGCYGAKGYRTPNIDRLARQGMRFTDFYAAQAVCSASRVALLTGCYPNRLGILGALGPKSKVGIHSNEVLVAEMLKQRGYATAIYGKWHLGVQPPFLPTRHGFDDYFGLPYSNDMWPFHPTAGTNYPPLPLFEGERIVEYMPDQTRLTAWSTERAVKFIGQHRSTPFFLYLPHNMPHVPLFVSDKFKGRTKRGLFGDVLEEIDWSVGEILSALKRHALEERTLVIFTSDNGPWLSYGDHAGSAGRLREGKATTFEGGVRVPFIARWPGKIPAGKICREPAMTIDLFPTLAGLVGGQLPAHRIDGLDIWPLLSGQRGARSPHEALYFYWDNELQAVRSGPWKLHVAHDYHKPDPPGHGGQPGRMTKPKTPPALFNLAKDTEEMRDVSARHPDVVRRLEALLEKARADLGDSLSKRTGSGLREPGRW